MKAAPFAYLRAESVGHAVALLAEHGGEARLLAGGQSLLPALAMRLAEPALLVDIGNIRTLDAIDAEDETIRIGALARHAALERSTPVARSLPLLSEAIAHVAHPAVRNRGTLGGSLAWADPAAELPACCLALDATLVLCSPRGERRIAADGFFVDLLETALAPDEMIVAVELPRPAPGTCATFIEEARRHGDYASAGLAATARRGESGWTHVRLAFLAAGRTPLLAKTAARELSIAGEWSPAVRARARDALAADLDPIADPDLTAAHKLHLAGVLLERALDRLSEDRPPAPDPTGREPARAHRPASHDRPDDAAVASPGRSHGHVAAETGRGAGARVTEVTVDVNGTPETHRIEARMHLADFLRERVGLTGTHLGCEHGVCGACTVRLDGAIVRACLVLAVQARGHRVDTVEGMTDSGELAALQGAFHERAALQCGFCTPGMLIAAHALVEDRAAASRSAIRRHLAGNYCRCTGYQAIVDAVEAVLRERRAG